MFKYTKTKKALGLIISLIFIAFSACLVYSKLFLSNKKPMFVFNHAFFIVASPSMLPQFPVNTLVVIKRADVVDVAVGDVVVFKANALDGKLAFHRVVRITDEGIFVKGDNNLHEDNQAIDMDSLVGRYVHKSVFFGRILSFVGSFVGIFVIIIMLLGCLLLKKAIALSKK